MKYIVSKLYKTVKGTVVNQACHVIKLIKITYSVFYKNSIKSCIYWKYGKKNKMIYDAYLQSTPRNCIKGDREESCDSSAILGLVL